MADVTGPISTLASYGADDFVDCAAAAEAALRAIIADRIAELRKASGAEEVAHV